MTYPEITPAVFLERPNRFIARVRLDGKTETVHVKNTGRCRELLQPGASVFLTAPGTPGRKTKYDLIAVEKDGGLFNIDSQAPNEAVREWLSAEGFDAVTPEYRYGDSRIDFSMEKDGGRYLLEVKGCTLVTDGVGYFPDAPTERGVKHIRELMKAREEGFHTAIAFVIQTEGVTEVRPNAATHPAFAQTLAQARDVGVKILSLPCRVTPQSLTIREDAHWEAGQ